MKGFAILLGAAVVASLVFVIAAGFAHNNQAAASATLKTPWTGSYPAQQTIRSSTYMDIFPTKGSEHVPMANFAVSPGVPVTLTIRNYTREAHTFSAPSLGLNFKIAPGSPTAPTVTRFTLVAPYGVFAWHCRDCPGDMQGKIYAIAGASSAQAA
jgi:hypothetical protein